MQMNQTDSQAAIKNKIIEQVTVLGQGVMGVDIALTFAIAGYEVTAVDLFETQLEKAEKRAEANCMKMVAGGLLDKVQAQSALQCINRSMDWDAAITKADFIMEVIPEDMEKKTALFTRCDKLCTPEVIIASNTSSMSITRISE
jgi:3-hydroxybutyryl-CoA dehydrogenase